MKATWKASATQPPKTTRPFFSSDRDQGAREPSPASETVIEIFFPATVAPEASSPLAAYSILPASDAEEKDESGETEADLVQRVPAFGGGDEGESGETIQRTPESSTSALIWASSRDAQSFFPPIQPKLTVGRPNDPPEREADAVADQVVRALDSPAPDADSPSQSEAMHIGRSPASDHVRLQTTDSASPRGAELEGKLNSTKGGGQPLESETRGPMEDAFGADFSDVRIHTGSDAAELNDGLGARAFAHGQDVYFNDGQFEPDTKEGQKLLAHELTHTIQQDGGTPSARRQPDENDNTPATNEQNADSDRAETSDEAGQGAGADGDTGTSGPGSTDAAASDDQGAGGNTSSSTDPGATGANPSDAGNDATPSAPGPAGTAPAQGASPTGSSVEDPASSGAPSSGGTSATATASAPAGAVPDSSITATPQSFPDFEAFSTYVATQRTSTETFYDQKKQELQKIFADEKGRIRKVIQDQIQSLSDALSQTVRDIESTHQQTQSGIERKRDEEVEQAEQVARDELAKIEEVIGRKKENIRAAGEEQATQVQTSGEDEAAAALRATETNAQNVYTAIDAKEKEHSHRENAADVAAEARENVPRTVREIRDSGNALATAVKDQANGLAQKYRDEANEIAAEFDKPRDDSRKAVLDKKQETVDGLKEAAKSAVDGLNEETPKLIAELKSSIEPQITDLRGLPGVIDRELDDVLQQTSARLEEDKTTALAEIEKFRNDVSEISWHPDEVQSAHADLVTALQEHLDDVSAYVIQVGEKLNPTGKELTDSLTRDLAPLSDQIRETHETYREAATDLSGETSTKLDEISGESKTSTESIATALDSGLQETIEESKTEWSEQVSEDIEDLREKVADGLEDQDKILEKFIDNLDDEFQDSDSFWDLFGGILEGLWDGFTSLVSGLLKAIKTVVFWVVVAVVVIVVLVVAAIVAVVAKIAFGAALVIVLKVLLVVGIIVGVIVGIVFIARALFTPGLTWRERGRLIGRGFFELLLSLIGTGIYARLVGWLPRISRLVQIAKRIGDMSRFLRLVAKIKDVKLFIRLLDVVGDVGTFFRILEKASDANALLKILDKADDLDRAVRLLGRVDKIDDVIKILAKGEHFARVFDLLESAATLGKVDDVVRLMADAKDLGKLLDVIDNARDLERILEVLDSAGDLEKLINALHSLTDIGQFMSVFGRVSGAQRAKLISLVEEVTDVNALVKALDQATDAEKVLRLADKVADANLLVEVLKNGHGELDRLVTLLDTVADADKALTVLKGLGADVVDFIKLLDEPGMTLGRLESLLAVKNLNVAKFRALLAQAGGKVDDLMEVVDVVKDLVLVEQYVIHFGNFANLLKIVQTAKASNMPVKVITVFLKTCARNGFKKVNEIERFLGRVVAHGDTSIGTWRKTIGWGIDFKKWSVGNTTGYPGRTVADPAAPHQRVLQLANGSNVTVTLNADDVKHFASRHTWKFFKMTAGNAKQRNTMWPPQMDHATIENLAKLALNSDDVKNLVKTMSIGQKKIIEVALPGVSYKHSVMIDLQSGANGLVSFHAVSSPLTPEIPQQLMKAAVWLWKSL